VRCLIELDLLRSALARPGQVHTLIHRLLLLHASSLARRTRREECDRCAADGGDRANPQPCRVVAHHTALHQTGTLQRPQHAARAGAAPPSRPSGCHPSRVCTRRRRPPRRSHTLCGARAAPAIVVALGCSNAPAATQPAATAAAAVAATSTAVAASGPLAVRVT